MIDYNDDAERIPCINMLKVPGSILIPVHLYLSFIKLHYNIQLNII